MDFRIFTTYYQLSTFDKKLPELLCKQDPEHMSLIPTIDENDSICLECFACGYKMRPGSDMYNKLKESVENLIGEPTGY